MNVIKDFPILKRKIDGNKIVYLDNGATTQKPQAVIDALTNYYSNHNSNIHRGIYTLSEEASKLYDDSLKAIADFVGSNNPEEIILTKGTTESINRVAKFLETKLSKGDEILVTDAEHHSNLVPWQILAKKTGATLKYLETNKEGEITHEEINNKLTRGTKVVALAHVSNVLGTIFPVKKISKMAKEAGAYVVIDGAQAVPHMKVNVKSIGCDFYAFSAHKMLGPTGIGVLWGKREVLDQMEPYEYGGGMIEKVQKESSTWAKLPHKFEAGTPNIAGAIGFAAAIHYLEKLDLHKVQEHEKELVEYALKELTKVPEVNILGSTSSKNRSGLVSFTVKNIHPHDIATVLSTKGVAVRAGQHCAMPLHDKLKIPASVRASFYVYNTKEDIDALVEGIKEAIKFLN